MYGGRDLLETHPLRMDLAPSRRCLPFFAHKKDGAVLFCRAAGHPSCLGRSMTWPTQRAAPLQQPFGPGI